MDTIFTWTVEGHPAAGGPQVRKGHYPFYQITWKSLERLNPRPRVVVVENGSDPEFLKQIPKWIEVVRGPGGIWDGVMWGGIFRLNEVKQTMEKMCNRNDKVMFCDCRDMLFQSNPFEHPLSKKYGLLLIGEGTKLEHDEWNRGEIHTCGESIEEIARVKGIRCGCVEGFGQLPFVKDLNWKGWPAVCAGMISGEIDYVTHFLKCVYHLASQWRNGTDQGCYTYFYNAIFNNPSLYTTDHLHLADPKDEDWCLSGTHYRICNVIRKPDGTFWNTKCDKPYMAVHQWCRTEWRDALLKEYNNA